MQKHFQPVRWASATLGLGLLGTLASVKIAGMDVDCALKSAARAPCCACDWRPACGFSSGLVSRILRTCVGAFLLVAHFGCGQKEHPTLEFKDMAPGIAWRALSTATAPTTNRFTALPAESTGVDFIGRLKPEHNVPFLINGFGVAIGDYDGDGRPDVYLLSLDSPNRLYRQVGPWRFEDVTDVAGVDGGEAWSRGATFVDIDSDGDLDLYVCNAEAPNLLYVNRGDGTFSEEAGSRGLDHVGASNMAYFADYDRDGDLDTYLVTHRTLSFVVPEAVVADFTAPSETRRAPLEMLPPTPERLPTGELGAADPEHWFRAGPRYEIVGEPDLLLRNKGDGSFEDVTKQAGVFDRGLGLSAAWIDVDGDGWLDLHVGNDLLTPDRLYRNNRDGTFTESLAQILPITAWFSMGSDCADIDNDGRLDFVVADMSATTHYRSKILMGEMSSYRWFMTHEWPPQLMRNALYRNTGTGRFMEIAHLAGVASSDWTWAVKFSDLDNDGWVDLFFTNGAPRDDMNPDYMGFGSWSRQPGGDPAFESVFRGVPPAPDRNLAFRNNRDLAFHDVSSTWGLDHKGVSYGAAASDLDRDGDLDLVVNNLNEPASLYRNDLDGGHALLVQLEGTSSNASGVGALVTLETTACKQTRQLMLARGYLSADEPCVHFGTGAEDRALRLRVVWPSGHTQSFENLPAGRLYRVREPSGRPAVAVAPVEQRTQFTQVAAVGLQVKHHEQEFDDYALQPLLPGKLSQLGPGVAAADVDADGDDDLYIAGAAGQPGSLFINGGERGFERRPGPWDEDAAHEGMAPLFLDIDGDDDLDLLVTSGGVEAAAGSALLQDCLYIHDGQGGFTRAPTDVLGDRTESTGCAAAADFDRDGDLDLFLGARVVPGQYPIAPQSALLRNDGGRFTDVTHAAPGLARVGLVTSALWSDTDGDGWVDLLVALEWGPLRLFRNHAGQLEERTADAGLADRLGWWNSIHGADLDHDGDIDYVALNTGWNTKYGTPTQDKPLLLFYGDMDGSGHKRLIEAKTGRLGLLPIRGRSCSSAVMPYIGAAFPTFHDFASAVLSDIYAPERLADAEACTATELASGVFLNDGHARFAWRPLPRLAQASPGFGVATTDLDGDGHADVTAVQNLFTREPETGAWGGGVGIVLRGHGDGRLSVVEPAESGLIVPGDAKGLAVLDWDRDGWPDLAVAQNDDRLLLFRNRGVAERRNLVVRLRGRRGNPTAVGARVTVSATRPSQTAEVYAGSGYLSQSSSSLFFGLGSYVGACDVAVHWPDGQRSSHRVRIDDATPSTLELRHPDVGQGE